MVFKRVLFMLLVVFVLKNTEARDKRYSRSRTLKPTNVDRAFYVEFHNKVRRLVSCLYLLKLKKFFKLILTIVFITATKKKKS